MTHQMKEEISDANLVRLAQMGEWNAFDSLTVRYEQLVYSLALRVLQDQQDAEIVTQQTFEGALADLANIRCHSSVAVWLLHIASRAILERIRERKARQLSTFPYKRGSPPKRTELKES